MQINIQAACKLLKEQDNIVIIAHGKPDGDTLGSCFALYLALKQLGKTVRVESPDGFPQRYSFIYGENYIPESFNAQFIITADIASTQLLYSLKSTYENKVDLCIDHHKSNDLPARFTLLDAKSPATAQIMYYLIVALGAKIDKPMANALFTGISTDTGCFKYDNVTPETHRVAACLLEAGAEHGQINKLMFDTRTKARVSIEKMLLDTLEYHFNDECAVITVYAGTPLKYGVSEDELDGISAIPRKIEGVKVGMTIRERNDGSVKISLRSGDGIDASKICANFGGGGHMNAAGCTIVGTRDEAKEKILKTIKIELDAVK